MAERSAREGTGDGPATPAPTSALQDNTYTGAGENKSVAPKPCTAQLEQFLHRYAKALRDHQLDQCEITVKQFALSNDAYVLKQRQRYKPTPGDMRAAVNVFAGRSNVFWGGLYRAGTRRDSKQNLCEKQLLIWVDIDDAAGKGLDTYDKLVAHLRARGVGLPTLTVWSGHGWHLYYLLSEPISVQQQEALLQALASRLGGDRQSAVAGHLLRLPCTENRKPGKAPVPCTIIQYNDIEYPPDIVAGWVEQELRQLLADRNSDKGDSGGAGRKSNPLSGLSIGSTSVPVRLNRKPAEVVPQLLVKLYHEGRRHILSLAWAGLAAKARVPFDEALQVALKLADMTGDGEKCNRVEAVVHTYCKADPQNCQAYKQEAQQKTGCNISNITAQADRISWKSLLEKAGFSEDELALFASVTRYLKPEGIKLVEGISGRRFLVTPEATYLAVYKLRGDERVTLFQPLLSGPVEEVKHVYVEEDGVEYVIVRVGRTICKGPLPQAVDCVLQTHNIHTNRSSAKSYLTDMLIGMIRSGLAEEISEYEAWPPGAYHEGDGRITINIEPPTPDELREAVQALRELDPYMDDKWRAIIVWGLAASLHYALRMTGRPEQVRWVYLYGRSATGKSTLASIIASIWGETVLGGGSLATEARVAWLLEQATWPAAVDEARYVFEKPAALETIKTSITGLYSRVKLRKNGDRIVQRALRSVIMTGNDLPQVPSEIARRFIFVEFASPIPLDRREEFVEKYDKARGKLHALGPGFLAWARDNCNLQQDNVYACAERFLLSQGLSTYAGTARTIMEWVEKSARVSLEGDEDDNISWYADKILTLIRTQTLTMSEDDYEGSANPAERLAEKIVLAAADKGITIYSRGPYLYIVRTTLTDIQSAYRTRIQPPSLRELAERLNADYVRTQILGHRRLAVKLNVADYASIEPEGPDEPGDPPPDNDTGGEPPGHDTREHPDKEEPGGETREPQAGTRETFEWAAIPRNGTLEIVFRAPQTMREIREAGEHLYRAVFARPNSPEQAGITIRGGEWRGDPGDGKRLLAAILYAEKPKILAWWTGEEARIGLDTGEPGPDETVLCVLDSHVSPDREHGTVELRLVVGPCPEPSVVR